MLTFLTAEDSWTVSAKDLQWRVREVGVFRGCTHICAAVLPHTSLSKAPVTIIRVVVRMETQWEAGFMWAMAVTWYSVIPGWWASQYPSNEGERIDCGSWFQVNTHYDKEDQEAEHEATGGSCLQSGSRSSEVGAQLTLSSLVSQGYLTLRISSTDVPSGMFLKWLQVLSHWLHMPILSTLKASVWTLHLPIP